MAHYREYKITPMGAPRQTRADAWKDRPVVLQYRAFRDQVNLMKVKVENGDNIEFCFPFPKSWPNSKKIKMAGQPMTSKPDLDNCIKALLDAVYRDSDDAHIHCLGKTEKIWGYDGLITITNFNKGESNE